LLTVVCRASQHQVTGFGYKNHNRLSIIDPNNPENDIAGGSSNAGTVLSHFANAHQQLTQRMVQLAQDPNRAGKSILEVIMGGNYSSFENQRNYLQALAEERYHPPARSSSGNRSKESSDRGHRPNKQFSSSSRPPHTRNGGNSRRRK
jgi:non-canonical poly(A) RNA polymerase PAPD5/7